MTFQVYLVVLGIWILHTCQAEVYYVCFDEEHSSVVDIQCTEGTVLNIEEAGYGRSKWGLCRDLIKTSQNNKCYVQTNVTMECCGFSYCYVHVKRMFIESCEFRAATFLKIIYECVPEKSTFVCGPPRLNLPMGDSGDVPKYIPGHHILGDVYFTQPTDTGILTEPNTTMNKTLSDHKTKNEMSEVTTEQIKPHVEPTEKLKVPNKKMAVMMITSPPDIAGYKIVNEDGSEHIPDKKWHILHGNDAVAVWACLGVGLLIIFLLIMVLIYLCGRSPSHTKAQEVCQQEPSENHSKPQYQESEFGCTRYSDTQQGVSTEHNNNKLNKNPDQVNNRKDINSHINRAFAGDYGHKVAISNSKKRSHQTAAVGLCRGNGLIVTPQDPISACLRSPSSIISLSDDENSSLTDSGVETTSKHGSRQNSREKKDIKKKAPILKASNNRSNCAKRPTSLDVPPECHKMRIKETNDVHDIIVL